MNPWEKFFNESMPLLKETLLAYAREHLYDGFETYGDYVKYGEMFGPIVHEYVPIYTPPERQLTDGRPRSASPAQPHRRSF